MAAAPAASDYDAVLYPSSVFQWMQPDRLAVVARLHGLRPPPVETARVLEIGGGDGLNLMSAAVAHPQARFRSFDLAALPVATGRRRAAEAGLANVRVELADAVAASETLDGEYDYVIAHGFYAWVPPPVQDAALRLIGRVLAPDGVAAVSYNALPGAHVRRAMREMVLEQIDPALAGEARLAAARAILEAFAPAREGDRPFVAAMRIHAGRMLEKPPHVLHHDELGPCYNPVTLTGFARAAAGQGLRFLGDAQHMRIEDGFLPDDAADRSTEAALAAVQAEDYAQARAFRHTLLVRDSIAPPRVLRSDALADLHVTIDATQPAPGRFERDGVSIAVTAPGMVAAIEAAMRAFPGSRPVAELFRGKAQLDYLFRLFQAGLARLSTRPSPCAAAIAKRPRASPLAQVLVREGLPYVATLDQCGTRFEAAEARALLLLLDGTRDRAELAKVWRTIRQDSTMSLDDALRSLNRAGLILA